MTMENPFEAPPFAADLKNVYTTEVVSDGGRDGTVESDDGALDLKLAWPPDGKNENTNPEQLFAAAYAACFHSAVMSHAEKGKIKLIGSSMTAVVSLNEDKSGGYHLAVEMRGSLPGLDEGQAQDLMKKAHQSCPYSKALRGEVKVHLQLD